MERKGGIVDKQTIARDIKIEFGSGLVNVKQVAKYVGLHRNQIPHFLEGLEYLRFGNQRKYTASDIAARIIARKQ